MITFSLALLLFACAENEDVTTTTPGKEKVPPYLNYESETDFWFPYEKGDTLIAVKDVNGAYRATVAEGGEWCTVSEVSVNFFRINYAENRRAEDRTTKITLSLDGVDDIDIIVSQRGPFPTLVIDSAYVEMAVPYAGGDTAVKIRTNSNYKVEVEAGNDWCVANAEETELKLNIPQNSGLASRSAKIDISFTYLDSTVRFEFVVNQDPTPILLVLPEDGTEIDKASGFPYTMSWTKTGDIPSYSIAVSTSSNFPEDATQITTVGNYDTYPLEANDIAEVMAINYENTVPLYWKVMPTDTTIDIATETRTFYVLRKLETQTPSSTYPLTLNGGNSSWIAFEEDEDGYPTMQLNAGQSSRRTWICTHPLEEEIPAGKVIALVYEYKITNKPNLYTYTEVDLTHYAGGYNENFVSTLRCPITEEWQTNLVPLRAGRSEWGQVGNITNIMARPLVVTTSDNTISGTRIHFRNIIIAVYDE